MADTEIRLESKEEVAYKLMQTIAHAESKDDKFGKPDSRTYYLTLFYQCVRAGNAGRDLKDILTNNPPGKVMT